MTESPITFLDIATFATIASSTFAIVFGLLKFLIGYLESKFGSGMTVADQSRQCSYDHQELNSVLSLQNANMSRQNENIKELLKQNGEQIKALSEANHAAQLRHEIVLNKLERIEDKVSG